MLMITPTKLKSHNPDLSDKSFINIDDFSALFFSKLGHEYYLENSWQVSKVENIVELGRSGQHLDFSFLPQMTSCSDQLKHKLVDFFRETSFLVNRQHGFNHLNNYVNGKYSSLSIHSFQSDGIYR